MIIENFSLKEHSSFYIGGNAQYYAEVQSEKDLINAIKFSKTNNLNITVLGKASNVIISDDGIKGLVIHFTNKQITINNKHDDYTIVTSDAGLTWDKFVQYCVDSNLYGIENLSYVPGTVGASAIQNIGAYGQEVKDTIKTIHAYDLKEDKFIELSNKDCNFSYRSSIFNTSQAGRYIIHKISFKLTHKPNFSLEYQDLAEYRTRDDITLAGLRNHIINIRKGKMPDYKVIPNVGSFFKNAIISKQDFNDLKHTANIINPEFSKNLAKFDKGTDQIKVSTAFLIELCGLKGYKQEHISIYEKHALIITHHSKKGNGKDLINFVNYVIDTVYSKLNIKITTEANFIK